MFTPSPIRPKISIVVVDSLPGKVFALCFIHTNRKQMQKRLFLMFGVNSCIENNATHLFAMSLSRLLSLDVNEPSGTENFEEKVTYIFPILDRIINITDGIIID